MQGSKEWGGFEDLSARTPPCLGRSTAGGLLDPASADLGGVAEGCETGMLNALGLACVSEPVVLSRVRVTGHNLHTSYISCKLRNRLYGGCSSTLNPRPKKQTAGRSSGMVQVPKVRECDRTGKREQRQFEEARAQSTALTNAGVANEPRVPMVASKACSNLLSSNLPPALAELGPRGCSPAPSAVCPLDLEAVRRSTRRSRRCT